MIRAALFPRSSYLSLDDGQNPNQDKYCLPFGGNLLAELIRRLGGLGDKQAVAEIAVQKRKATAEGL